MFRSAVGRLAVVARSAVKAGRPVSATCPVLKQSVESSYIFQRTFASGWVSPTFPLSKEASKSTETALVEEYEHATGLEREEIEAQLEGTSRFELAPPRGPFGTKEAPAVVESQFDERIVGCSGGYGEEEHDVVWFKLKKDAAHDCVVCGQVFQLKVVGEGGLPGQHH